MKCAFRRQPVAPCRLEKGVKDEPTLLYRP